MHINYELVRLGFASVNIFPPSLKYVPELVTAEREAEANKLGIWGYSEYNFLIKFQMNFFTYQRFRQPFFCQFSPCLLYLILVFYF
jgi:hypothetical protein